MIASQKQKWIAGVAAVSMCPVLQASAQDTSAPAGQTQTGSALLEEVIVQARKRAGGEAAQDTPISVSAFSGAQFEAVFAQNLDDIGRLAPGVQLKPSSQVGGQNFTIRGMGVSGTTPSDEPAVAIFQDGVYWGSNYGALLDTFDVESIEVLRGPQGTLFGRNVTGGAVLIRTARPTGDFGAQVETTVGNYGRFDVAGRIEGPILGEKLAGKISVQRNSLDGYYDNLFTGDEFGESESTLVRATLLAHLTDSLTGTLVLERFEQDGDSVGAVGVEVPGNLPYNAGYRAPNRLWSLRLDNPGDSDVEVDFGVLTLEWEVGNGLFTSITGVRSVEVENFTDFDGSQFDYFTQSVGFDQDQFSQELLYAANAGDRVKFTTGLYYLTQDYKHIEGRQLSLSTNDLIGSGELDQWSYAAFGEADIRLADAWNLSLGARYTKEKKEARNAPFRPVASVCADGTIYGFGDCDFPFSAKDDHTWDDVSPRVMLSFKPVDGQMVYGSVTRGFRSGGYAQRGLALGAPFDAEEVTAYEVGYKGELADGRVRLNTAVYVNKYKDLQRTSLGTDAVLGVVQNTFNVADATIQGFEADLVAEVVTGLVLSLSYGYTDAEYDSAVANFNTDLDFVRVPKNAGSASISYELGLSSGGTLNFRIADSYTGSQFFNDANTVKESSYQVVDTSVTWQDADQRWTAAAFVRNLTNEEYAFWGSTLGALGANRFVGPPRNYGVKLGYKF